jgi:hypothetical protein
MDIASLYTLTPGDGGPAVVFNNGQLNTTDDIFWLTDIHGLDTADIRTPQFLRPLADGGYKPVPWREHPLHPRFQGAFLVQSVPLGANCRALRNAMYHALKTCLRGCRTNPGTLAWSEPGIGDFTLPVSYEVKLDHGYDAGFTVMTFTFGLYAEVSQPVAA